MSVGGWIAFTLFISAARYDADEAQQELLRAQVTPLLEDLKRSELSWRDVRQVTRIALERTQTIMGPRWVPKDEWMQAINAMIGKER